MYENRIMKPIKIIFKRWGRGKKRVTIGGNLTDVHDLYVWKNHNGTPLYN